MDITGQPTLPLHRLRWRAWLADWGGLLVLVIAQNWVRSLGDLIVGAMLLTSIVLVRRYAERHTAEEGISQ